MVAIDCYINLRFTEPVSDYLRHECFYKLVFFTQIFGQRGLNLLSAFGPYWFAYSF
jgi:hypothetical protein